MDFNRENWRKLYTAESLEHRLWSLFTRCLRDHLIRLAKDDGTLLPRTTDPCGDMATILNARGDEVGAVREAIEILIGDAYLSWKGGRLWITRFEEGQARSTSAERMRKHRARKRTENIQGCDVTVTSPVRVTRSQVVTETKRNETKRSEEEAPHARIAPSVPSPTAAAAQTIDPITPKVCAASDPRIDPIASAIRGFPELHAVVADAHGWVERHVLPNWLDDDPRKAAAIREAVGDAAAATPSGEPPGSTLKRLRAFIRQALRSGHKRPSNVRPMLSPEERQKARQRAILAEQREAEDKSATLKLAGPAAANLSAMLSGIGNIAE